MNITKKQATTVGLGAMGAVLIFISGCPLKSPSSGPSDPGGAVGIISVMNTVTHPDAAGLTRQGNQTEKTPSPVRL